MLLRGNAYPCMGYHGGAWEPVNLQIDYKIFIIR